MRVGFGLLEHQAPETTPVKPKSDSKFPDVCASMGTKHRPKLWLKMSSKAAVLSGQVHVMEKLLGMSRTGRSLCSTPY